MWQLNSMFDCKSDNGNLPSISFRNSFHEIQVFDEHNRSLLDLTHLRHNHPHRNLRCRTHLYHNRPHRSLKNLILIIYSSEVASGWDFLGIPNHQSPSGDGDLGFLRPKNPQS